MVRDVQANGFKSMASVISLIIISTMTATIATEIAMFTNHRMRSMMSIVLSSGNTFAKDRGADTDHRCALLDRNFEVVSHTH
jgi:hypothetical protein